MLLTSCISKDINSEDIYEENHIIKEQVDVENIYEGDSEKNISSGVFVGFIDNNSLKVIDDEYGFVVFYKNGLYNEFSNLNLKTGDIIRVGYDNKGSQRILDSLKIIVSVEEELLLITDEVLFNGIIDNNSFEVSRGAQILSLRLDETPKKIEEHAIKESDTIEVTWYENINGQLIVIWLNK
ncbi:MAG: hypothetical protein ACOWWH_03485 [Eubacteriaceae bacterium]